MTRNPCPARRPVGFAIVMGAALALGACDTLSEAFKGINPVSQKLDETASKGGSKSDLLSIPPGYALRPKAGKAATGSAGSAGSSPKADGKKSAKPAGDPKKIDLDTGTDGDSVDGRTLDKKGRIVREDRVETRGKEIVKEGDPSKGERELLKPPPKKKS